MEEQDIHDCVLYPCFFAVFFAVSQVAKEIWVCDGQRVQPWPGDIQSYKRKLKKEAMKI